MLKYSPYTGKDSLIPMCHFLTTRNENVYTLANEPLGCFSKFTLKVCIRMTTWLTLLILKHLPVSLKHSLFLKVVSYNAISSGSLKAPILLWISTALTAKKYLFLSANCVKVHAMGSARAFTSPTFRHISGLGAEFVSWYA